MKSFYYAFRGIAVALRSEANLRFHFIAALIVVATGFYVQLSTPEWLVIVLCIGMVTAFELLNTAIEQLCNHVTPQQHPAIRLIKDISAAAVLMVSISSAAAGLIIFLPKFFQF
jgi:diacylglycerol kinase